LNIFFAYYELHQGTKKLFDKGTYTGVHRYFHDYVEVTVSQNSLASSYCLKAKFFDQVLTLKYVCVFRDLSSNMLNGTIPDTFRSLNAFNFM